MVGLSRGKFRIVLLTPKAKLLDCRCGSVVLPAHDGQTGILRNHCPMLSELGFGIMQVHEIADRPDAFFIINGGFVRVSENHVTVLAYDVTTFEGMSEEDVEHLVSHAHSVVVGQAYIRTQQEVIDHKKAKYIVQMAEMVSMRAIQPESGE
ncbi:MAG: F0F1 ATP synthase subunit epsilon [Phycisphaerae bacterium]|nr:F0F1 ATP synthase subunit epsilon [Phycisphaerae bacterium]